MNDKRERWHSLLPIFNAVLWLNGTGVQWREMESRYACWRSVYFCFGKWKLSGIWEQLPNQ